ncbi:MAG: ATP synthase F1 subunit epsilon [Candidatus Brocadiaceae bacterium]|nr:ATP synthase F1 subunit epsilon [Candidatus Brocadiaceae bacterium]
MAKTFNFEIITPVRVVYNGVVQGISADGTEGSFGVLADHAPLVTELKTGIIMVEDSSGKTMRFAVEGGFLEVVANNVVVLTDTCITEGEVDIEKARAEKDAAEKALTKAGSAEDKKMAQAALKRADTWLKLANAH